MQLYLHKIYRLNQANIHQLFEKSSQLRKLKTAIAESENLQVQTLYTDGLIGSSLSLVLSSVFKDTEAPFLLIFNDKEEAAYHLNDLEQLVGEKDVLFYPGSYRRPYQIEETNNANVLLRAEVLNRINSRKKPAVIVTYPDALFEKVVTRKELDKTTLKIKLDDVIPSIPHVWFNVLLEGKVEVETIIKNNKLIISLLFLPIILI